jgi:hypothetical protein
MTPEAQDIGIAQACGFTTHKRPDGWIEWRWPSGVLIGRYPKGQCPSIVPKYTMYLDAMHEAETTQRTKDSLWWKGYSSALYHAFGVSATAAQRAELFLRTLNLWRDDV